MDHSDRTALAGLALVAEAVLLIGNWDLAGAYMNSVAEGLAAVAFLGVVDTLPATATRFHGHPGVRYVPLRDASFATVAVARRRTDSRAVVHSFCDVAVEVARRFRSVVPAAVAPARQ